MVRCCISTKMASARASEKSFDDALMSRQKEDHSPMFIEKAASSSSPVDLQ